MPGNLPYHLILEILVVKLYGAGEVHSGWSKQNIPALLF